MPAIRAIGAIVRLDPEPAQRLSRFERQGGDAGIDEDGESLVSEYASGEWALGRLHCWAAVEGPDGRLTRRDGVVVDAVWLRVGDVDSASRHAAEMFAMAVPRVHEELRGAGFAVDLEELEAMAPNIQLDDEVLAALSG